MTKHKPITEKAFVLKGLKHVACVMDGNGRWAKKQNRTRYYGHVCGAKRARSLIQYCSRIQLPYLSLFVLSTENLLRPKNEVQSLIQLLEKLFIKQADFLIKSQIKLHIIGNLSVFSKNLQNLCLDLCEKTKNNQGLNLIIALNYGGKQEILEGVKNLVKDIKNQDTFVKNLNEKKLASYFYSSKFPSPDLIIRTGGESRLSNFYLWSSAYSELYFTKTLWPDFDTKNLQQALKKFQKVQRRYGKI